MEEKSPRHRPDQRSAITNGSRLLQGVNGRSAEYRRYKDLYRAALAETGGRHDALCRQLAGLQVQREALDAALVRGEPVDPTSHVAVANAITRTLITLGIEPGRDQETPLPLRERLREATV
jgi:hypothetical protein